MTDAEAVPGVLGAYGEEEERWEVSVKEARAETTEGGMANRERVEMKASRSVVRSRRPQMMVNSWREARVSTKSCRIDEGSH